MYIEWVIWYIIENNFFRALAEEAKREAERKAQVIIIFIKIYYLINL